MLSIKEYSFPESAEAAWGILGKSGRMATVIGGGTFLNLGKKTVGMAVDLSRAGLDTLVQDDDLLEIGAMVPLGAFDRSRGMDDPITRFIQKSYRDIVGVQLRNMATFGGTIHARYGFSDVLTALMTLDVTIDFHRNGPIGLAEFMEHGLANQDILKSIQIERTLERWGYQSLRRSTSDFPMLTAAVSLCGGHWRAAVGARPGRAKRAESLMIALNSERFNLEDTDRLGGMIMNDLAFGGNSRASREYRQRVCGVLVSDALKEAGYDAD